MPNYGEASRYRFQDLNGLVWNNNPVLVFRELKGNWQLHLSIKGLKTKHSRVFSPASSQQVSCDADELT